MSLQDYYNEFRCGYWAEPDPEHCLCRGRGWALSDVDTWHKCPIHYKGQPSPEEHEEHDVRFDENGVVVEKPVETPVEKPVERSVEELPDLPF